MKNLREVDTCKKCVHALDDCKILFCNHDKSAPKPPLGTKWTQAHWDHSDKMCDWGADKIVSDFSICDLFERKEK